MTTSQKKVKFYVAIRRVFLRKSTSSSRPNGLDYRANFGRAAKRAE